MKITDELAKQILNALSKQHFADWYNNGYFDKFLTDDQPGDEEQILKDIKRLFQ